MHKKPYTLIVQVSETVFQWVNVIVLLKRWVWKGCFLVVLGKTIHVHCLSLPGDSAFGEIVYLVDSLEKTINWCHRVSL